MATRCKSLVEGQHPTRSIGGAGGPGPTLDARQAGTALALSRAAAPGDCNGSSEDDEKENARQLRVSFAVPRSARTGG